ncbi:unnamed protein product, partial [Nesidiocoris tenuis]
MSMEQPRCAALSDLAGPMCLPECAETYRTHPIRDAISAAVHAHGWLKLLAETIRSLTLSA